MDAAPNTVTEERRNLLGVSGRRTVRRWQYVGCHLAYQACIQLGWLPNGRWWVDDTRESWTGWVFTGPDPVSVRAAAENRARQRLAVDWCRGGRWSYVVPEYVPGEIPSRAAVVPDWPPGFEPATP